MAIDELKPVRKKRRLMPWLILTVLIIAAMSASALWFIKYRRAVLTNPNYERDQIVKIISPHVQLPAEQPVVLSVLDKSKLSNQSLARLVVDGDKLLIFNNSRRLVVYRPATQKVIEMLSIQDENLLKR